MTKYTDNNRLILRNIRSILYGSKQKGSKPGILRKPTHETPHAPKDNETFLNEILFAYLPNEVQELKNKDLIYDLMGRENGKLNGGGKGFRKNLINLINTGSVIDSIIKEISSLLKKWMLNPGEFSQEILSYIDKIPVAEATPEFPDYIDSDSLNKLLNYIRSHLIKETPEDCAIALSWLIVGAALRPDIKDIDESIFNTSPKISASEIALKLQRLTKERKIRPTTMAFENSKDSYHVNRDDLIKKIDSHLHDQSTDKHCIFLTAMGGEGKTELAREYACQNQGLYNCILWLDCMNNETPDLAEVLQHALRINDSDVNDILSDLEYLDAKTLIIADNYNSDTEYTFRRALQEETGDAHLIFTTRHRYEEDGFPHLFVTSDDQKGFAYSIFKTYYEKKDETYRIHKDEETYVEEICRLAQYHTMTIAMIATELRTQADNHSKITIAEFTESFRNGINDAFQSGVNIRIYKDGLSRSDTIIKILKFLFRDFLYHDFDEAQKQILHILSLMPGVQINTEFLCELLGDSTKQKYIRSACMRLIEHGWILSNEFSVSIHPLLSELFQMECSEKIKFAGSDYYQHLLTNWLVMDADKLYSEQYLINRIWAYSGIQKDYTYINLAVSSFLDINTTREIFSVLFPYTGIAFMAYADCTQGRLFLYYDLKQNKETIFFNLANQKTNNRYWNDFNTKQADRKKIYIDIKNIAQELTLQHLILCEKTTELIFPDKILNFDITEIPDHFCEGNIFLCTLRLPYHLKIIGRWAFSRCYNLSEIIFLPNTIQHIKRNAFALCIQLSGALQIPAGCKQIDSFAFAGCKNLNIDSFPSEDCIISPSAFAGCKNDLNTREAIEKINNKPAIQQLLNSFFSIEKPINHFGIYEDTHKMFKLDVTSNGKTIILDPIRSIGELACYHYPLTGTLIIPETVISIGKGAFCNCNGLTGDLIIPESVKTIDEHAFFFCHGLDGKLIINEGISVIGNSAFECCSSLKGPLIFPSSLSSIGKSAFYGCMLIGLGETLDIPENVKFIGDLAFSNCHFSTIIIRNPDIQLGENIAAGYTPAIYGPANSAVEAYAYKYRLPFRPINKF